MRGEFVIAVHALTYMHHNQRLVCSAELEENICSPAARIRKILAMLKQAGLVDTVAGAHGGYRLGRSAAEITLADCMAALQDVPVPLNWLSGDVDTDCIISSGMGAYMTTVQQDLNAVCMTRLQNYTIADVELALRCP